MRKNNFRCQLHRRYAYYCLAESPVVFLFILIFLLVHEKISHIIVLMHFHHLVQIILISVIQASSLALFCLKVNQTVNFKVQVQRA